MYSNNLPNFQESTTILNASTKKSWNLLNVPYIYIYIYMPECWAMVKENYSYLKTGKIVATTSVYYRIHSDVLLGL